MADFRQMTQEHEPNNLFSSCPVTQIAPSCLGYTGHSALSLETPLFFYFATSLCECWPLNRPFWLFLVQEPTSSSVLFASFSATVHLCHNFTKHFSSCFLKGNLISIPDLSLICHIPLLLVILFLPCETLSLPCTFLLTPICGTLLVTPSHYGTLLVCVPKHVFRKLYHLCRHVP